MQHEQQEHMYLVLFVTDYRKENETKAHKIFSNQEAAVEEAKKFTDPPAAFRGEQDELEDDGTTALKVTRDTSDGTPFKWNTSGIAGDSLYTGECLVKYEAQTTLREEHARCHGPRLSQS